MKVYGIFYYCLSSEADRLMDYRVYSNIEQAEVKLKVYEEPCLKYKGYGDSYGYEIRELEVIE